MVNYSYNSGAIKGMKENKKLKRIILLVLALKTAPVLLTLLNTVKRVNVNSVPAVRPETV